MSADILLKSFLYFLNNFPFVIIWVGTILVFFFLEFLILTTHTFNIKHTYLNALKRSNIFNILHNLGYQKLTLNVILNIFYFTFLR